MKIGAQLFTVSNFLKTKEDMDNTFKKIKEMGYDYIQYSTTNNGLGKDLDEEKVIYVKSLLDKYDLKICVTHMNDFQLVDDLENLIKYHKIWDCKYMGIGMTPIELMIAPELRPKFKKALSSGFKGANEFLANNPFEMDFVVKGTEEFIEMANKIGDRLAEEGMKFVFHNHHFELLKIDGETILDKIFNETNDNVEILLDTYWIQEGGQSPVEWINKLKGNLQVVHFKDYGMKLGGNFIADRYFAEIGSGNLNWEAIIQACENAGVEYAVVERDPGADLIDPFESLEISRNYLKNQFEL